MKLLYVKFVCVKLLYCVSLYVRVVSVCVSVCKVIVC